MAHGPAAVQFNNAGYGRHTATLASAGSYVLTATFGGKLASGALSEAFLVMPCPPQPVPIPCAHLGLNTQLLQVLSLDFLC